MSLMDPKQTHLNKNTSNHPPPSAAKDRSWFGADYTPFETTTGSLYTQKSVRAIGIGTVELPVKTRPNATGPRSHGILRLHNVLHIPELICNILGVTVDEDYANVETDVGKDSKGSLFDKDEKRIAYAPAARSLN